MLLSKERKSNEMYYGESVDCNIIMQSVIQCYLLSLQVLQNQQIVVLKPWLCGSENHAANGNKHHGEDKTSFFCCSARLCWSRHQPGYVQGGQGVGRDYLLLLRIHVRRIRGIDIEGFYQYLPSGSGGIKMVSGKVDKIILTWFPCRKYKPTLLLRFVL